MKFRPCIDIHNGQVKQIVGGTLKDAGDQASENFVAKQDAAFYANLYKKYELKGGHIILLNGLFQKWLIMELFPESNVENMFYRVIQFQRNKFISH